MPPPPRAGRSTSSKCWAPRSWTGSGCWSRSGRAAPTTGSGSSPAARSSEGRPIWRRWSASAGRSSGSTSCRRGSSARCCWTGPSPGAHPGHRPCGCGWPGSPGGVRWRTSTRRCAGWVPTSSTASTGSPPTARCCPLSATCCTASERPPNGDGRRPVRGGVRRCRPLPGGGGLVLLEDVLDLFAGLLEVARCLVGLPLGLEVTVVGGLAERLLALAPELLGLVLRLVDPAHERAPSLPSVYPASLPRCPRAHTRERS